MTEKNEKISILQACLGKVQNLANLAEYAAEAIVSKTILDKRAGTITLFAFDRGQKLSEHRSPYDAVVQVLDGTAELTIGGKKVTVSAGEIIIMPADMGGQFYPRFCHSPQIIFLDPGKTLPPDIIFQHIMYDPGIKIIPGTNGAYRNDPFGLDLEAGGPVKYLNTGFVLRVKEYF